MPLQGFVDGGLPTIKAAWLNAVDAFYFTLFNSATTAAQARTAIGVPATTDVLALAGGTMTGAVNMTKSTFNTNTATPDIWTSQANVIGYTNTTLVTGFAAAPVAGATRRLICAGAATFKSGANFTIRGVALGTTVTMKANAFVDITALTTTTFEMEYSLDGSFTATATGMTAGVTATWYYTVINGIVRISAHSAGLGGTSNATSFTVTGAPAEITPSGNRILASLTAVDNGSYISTAYGVMDSSSVLTLYKLADGTLWTNSGSKSLITAEFSYLL